MSAGRVFGGLIRVGFSRGMFVHEAAVTVRLNSVRSVALSSQRSTDSKDEEVNNGPLKFSTSKASHRTWRVNRSMGSQFERPWWKVLPISLVFSSFLLWCVLRGDTDIDVKLEKQLYEHLPGLLSDEEEENVQNKSS